MIPQDVLSGRAGLAGLQRLLSGAASRRRLRSAVEAMLRPGYRAGPFHLTRAKFKPGRKLSAYFTLPVQGDAGRPPHPVHLAVVWQDPPGEAEAGDRWKELQAEAAHAGLMPVQRELRKDLAGEGLRLQIWPLDVKFPQLVRLGSAEHVAGLLAALGAAPRLQELPLVTPIRYRPGERHVLRYEICPPGTPPGSGQRLYAKLYKRGEDAARAFGVANRVVDWLDASGGLDGNRPAAMSEEEGVILYPHAAGIPLSQQLHRSGRWLAAQLGSIGRALAVLHGGPTYLQVGLKENTFTDEARVVRRAAEHIQALLPGTYDRILEIVERAEGYYDRLPQEEPTFTHSDFKADHLLCTPRGLTLIDFDTCSRADPALDVGKFLADLEWWFTLKGLPGLKEAQDAVLDGYLGQGSASGLIYERLARARLFYVLILVKIVARRAPLYRKDWADLTERVIGQAAGALQPTVNA